MANYLKQGTNDNFIIDSAEIELAKFNNLRHSVLGYMLGNFDEHGIYTVDEEIVKELIAMKKYIVSTIDNVEICHSEIRLNRPITFLVTFEEDCATLSLAEKIPHEGNYKENGGSYSDINEFILDRVETSGVVNREAIYRRWRIGEFSGNARDISSLDQETKAELFGLINRFKYLLYANTYLLEKEEQLEEEDTTYAEEIKNLLSRYPKLNEAVNKNVKEKLASKKDFIRIDKPFVAHTINDIVEQSIAENLSVLKPKELQNFNAEKHEIVNQHNLRAAAILPMDVVKPVNNAENSVGYVVLDTTSLMLSTLSANKKTQISETVSRPEQRYSIEDLAKALNTQRNITETRLQDDAVAYITGQEKPGVAVPGQTPKQSKNARLQQVAGQPMQPYVSPSTTTAANNQSSARTEGGMIANAVNGTKRGKSANGATTGGGGRTSGVGKSAGGGGKSSGGGGSKPTSGKNAGGETPTTSKGSKTDKPATKTDAKPKSTKKHKVDPRLAGKRGDTTAETPAEETPVETNDASQDDIAKVLENAIKQLDSEEGNGLVKDRNGSSVNDPTALDEYNLQVPKTEEGEKTGDLKRRAKKKKIQSPLEQIENEEGATF